MSSLGPQLTWSLSVFVYTYSYVAGVFTCKVDLLRHHTSNIYVTLRQAARAEPQHVEAQCLPPLLARQAQSLPLPVLHSYLQCQRCCPQVCPGVYQQRGWGQFEWVLALVVVTTLKFEVVCICMYANILIYVYIGIWAVAARP